MADTMQFFLNPTYLLCWYKIWFQIWSFNRELY